MEPMIRVEQAPAAHERDWRWLDEPAPAVVSGLALAALHVTSGAGGGLLTAVPGATTAAGLLALLAVVLVVESAGRARPSGPTLPRRSLLWLAAVPGVAFVGGLLAPNPSLTPLLALPAAVVGAGVADRLDTRWPLVLSALAGAAAQPTLLRAVDPVPAGVLVLNGLIMSVLVLILLTVLTWLRARSPGGRMHRQGEFEDDHDDDGGPGRA